MLATLCGLLVALAGAGEGRRRLLWLLPVPLLQALAWDVTSTHWLIGAVLGALASRAFLGRRPWLAVVLATLAVQAGLASSTRPDISACRQVVHSPRPLQGTPMAWGPWTSRPLDGQELHVTGTGSFPPTRTATLRANGPLDPPFEGAGKATLVARPSSDELVLTLGAGSTIRAEERITRSLRIPVERGVDQIEVEIELAELVGGNWDGPATIGHVELSGGELVQLTLLGENWQFQGQGGVSTLEVEGVLRPTIWLRAGASTTLTLPADGGEFRYHGSSLGNARLQVERQGRSVHLYVEGEGIGLFGEPRQSWPHPDPPRVLVVMVDTLRADRADTPNLTRLAQEGLVFSQAWSTSAWTKPAIPTLMSGLEPSTHHVGMGGVGDRLPESVVTLADRFREQGWRTGSFSASPLGSTLSGLEQGFGTTLPPRHWGLERGREYPSAAQLHQSLVSWLDEEPDQPAMAYVHLMDVHEYESRRPIFSTVGDYEDAVAAWDHELGVLLEALGEGPLLVLVVSDHGESFGDHGVRRHGTGLWASQTHIPWVIWGSGLSGVVEHPVSLADVAPTLLELVGLPSLGRTDGLHALRRGGPVYSSLMRYTWKPDQPTAVSIVDGGLHRIEREDGLRVGYDTARDVCEATSVPSRDLEGLLHQWRLASVKKAEQFVEAHGPVGAAVRSDDLERLRALGYIE